jgi:hypothetical protein
MIQTDMAIHDHSGESHQIVNGLYGNRANPAAIGLSRSACLCKPDTGEPCPMVPRTKNNSECPHCAWRLGRPGRPTADLIEDLRNGRITFAQDETVQARKEVKAMPNPPKIKPKRKSPVCGWPGCGRELRVTGKWCKGHGETYRRRCKIWRNHFGKYALIPEAVFADTKSGFTQAIEAEKRRRNP